MAHYHGNEYQVRIIHADGTEKLSAWMNCEGQLAQAVAAVHRVEGEAYWLRERNVLCPDCLDKKQIIILGSVGEFVGSTPGRRCSVVGPLRPHECE